MSHELRIEDEFRELKAEGKRRQREHEGLPELAKDHNPDEWMVGKPGSELADASLHWGWNLEGAGFDLYDKDPEGLKREITDLERDIRNFETWQGVKYE
jgi:hypothetical protein